MKTAQERLDAIEERLSRLERDLFHLRPIGPINVQPDLPRPTIEVSNELVAKIEEVIRKQQLTKE